MTPPTMALEQPVQDSTNQRSTRSWTTKDYEEASRFSHRYLFHEYRITSYQTREDITHEALTRFVPREKLYQGVTRTAALRGFLRNVCKKHIAGEIHRRRASVRLFIHPTEFLGLYSNITGAEPATIDKLLEEEDTTRAREILDTLTFKNFRTQAIYDLLKTGATREDIVQAYPTTNRNTLDTIIRNIRLTIRERLQEADIALTY
ncbi:MAG: hypothetical protein Q7R96_02085 [Nanoarchaeota archaeon]|nr:hypothetical protein [Nanoarchaeota archaeon]